jgi:chorismate mutase
MASRGIRGAITVSQDTVEEVLQATSELLDKICEENDLEVKDIASIIFAVTSDIKSVYPARAARLRGWNMVPLLCFQDMEVTDALPHCIRVLVTINTIKSLDEIKHIYMRDAGQLRQDLMNNN